MPQDTMPLLFHVPLTVVQAVLEGRPDIQLEMLQRSLTLNGHGHTNGQAPHPDQEAPAPVLPSSAGAP